MRIIDPHHHLWDLRVLYYPWLTDSVRPRPWGDYASIRKNYLVSDLRADIGSLPVVKSVHVHAGHDPRHPVRETAWLQSVADDVETSGGFPHGIVADIDLAAPDAPAVLEDHCRHRNVRGVRQILSNILSEPDHYRDVLQDPRWWENARRIEKHGLSLDVQIYWQQAGAVRELAQRNDTTQMILCHTGMPADQSASGLEAWRRAMRQLAGLPNIAMKISGFSMFERDWTAASIRPLVLETIDIFGTDRCMFATNFPVDSLGATYAKIWNAYDEITRNFSDSERARLFHDNAARLYRI